MHSTASRRRPLRSLPPTETLDIGYGLSLAPRLKLILTFFRSDPAVKPVDEWQLKLSLIDFIRSFFSLTVPEDDLVIRKRLDLHKRKRDEPVASGTLYIRDLGFLKHKRRGDDDDDTDKVIEKKFLDWRASVLDRLSGIELNLEGVKFRMTVDVPPSDDYEAMKRLWEDYYASQLLDGRGYSKGVARRPDTIIVQGVPSRWFAEPRVSSKPSMLNTHTIFSVLGNIRNLYVVGGDDIGENAEATVGDVVPGLQCKVWVQFENHDEFSNAMRVLCGRSMQKQGSRLNVDYEVTWDKDIFFKNVPQKPTRGQERIQASSGNVQTEPSNYESKALRSGHDGARMRRFRD
ncbi:uncharacterized protein LOC110020857 isoform X2 [Phalaenopsis equestris]|uniref:uncharacterized protein LOC110020857 isoform X2 n=1 Tax=Phalaenopsis equestris TaxID=78828 RepID=UPI0009E533D3|nr:uncharacterized protein LOC110020857 isoform X2 [Phalaenopsis equestris]